jgi:hypothetical protein
MVRSRRIVTGGGVAVPPFIVIQSDTAGKNPSLRTTAR